MYQERLLSSPDNFADLLRFAEGAQALANAHNTPQHRQRNQHFIAIDEDSLPTSHTGEENKRYHC